MENIKNDDMSNMEHLKNTANICRAIACDWESLHRRKGTWDTIGKKITKELRKDIKRFELMHGL